MPALVGTSEELERSQQHAEAGPGSTEAREGTALETGAEWRGWLDGWRLW